MVTMYLMCKPELLKGQNINSSATAFRADVNADGLLDGNDAANVSTRVAQGLTALIHFQISE